MVGEKRHYQELTVFQEGAAKTSPRHNHNHPALAARSLTPPARERDERLI
jgi:hypothetical protein